jgi:hypothetical protein
MENHDQLIGDFYAAFNARDYVTMQQAYHAEAKFYDPVFEHLNAEQTKAMWQMLLSASKDIVVKASEISTNNNTGSCRWDAWYTFSRTGRKVHNIIHSRFQFRDGKIIDQHDHFSMWRWSRQALGTSGLLLGWSPMVKNKVRQTAQGSLRKYLETYS